MGEAYNRVNSSAPSDERENRLSGLTTSKSSVTTEAVTVPDSHPSSGRHSATGWHHVGGVREKRNSLRQFRRLFGRFVADECGVRFVPEVAGYDPRRAEKTPEKREPLTDGDIAQSERFLRELIRHPTIDPDQEAPVVIQGEAIPALKAAMLQGLARASQPKGGR
ncbi:hypothetical protein [Armatimonas sp.]|uniref:hypothetical protein n=1 Tax=Armatimonas sp. TaxID=1872638 RepID=UPI003750668E